MLTQLSSICVIAMEATKIPLAIFTDLFHHRFKKKLYLESTLELLQQFYIQLVDHSNHFCIFVSDCHKYCLHCARCHCAITRPDYIQCIFENGASGNAVALGNCIRCGKFSSWSNCPSMPRKYGLFMDLL